MFALLVVRLSLIQKYEKSWLKIYMDFQFGGLGDNYCLIFWAIICHLFCQTIGCSDNAREKSSSEYNFNDQYLC